MPEGDTLHRAAAQLAPILIGRNVAALELPRRSERTEAIVNRSIAGVEARGKNLLVHFDNDFSLHVHLKMLGRIFIRRRAEARAPGANTVVVLDTETHRVEVVHAPVARLIRTRDLVRDLHFRDLGPDVLGPSFMPDEAVARLRLRNDVPLGEALMDQGAVAGIGNVWKSELCFNLKLDPFAPLAQFADDELCALLALAQKQMRETVERKPRRIPDPFTPRFAMRRARIDPRLHQKPLSVYERSGQACYDCGSVIEMKRQGSHDRSTYYCARCQPSRSAA